MNADFRKELASLAESIGEKRQHSLNEEGTKLAFVLPFIRALGYDCSNPGEVTAEYTADTKSKNMDKVDYALMKDGKPIVFIECKHCGVDNLEVYHGQLSSYFVSTPEVRFAILTNGIKYLSYTDMENTNLLDTSPFLEVDLTNINDSDFELLEMFRKDRFNGEAISEAALEARDRRQVKASLEKELADPSDEFVRLLISPFFSGVRSKFILDRFRPYVLDAIADFKIDSGFGLSAGEASVTPNHGYSSAFTKVVEGILEEAGFSTRTFEGRIRKDSIRAIYRKCWICLFNFDEHGLNVRNIQFMQPFVENGKLIESKRNLADSFLINSAGEVRKFKDRIVAAAKDIDDSYKIYYQQRKKQGEV